MWEFIVTSLGRVYRLPAAGQRDRKELAYALERSPKRQRLCGRARVGAPDVTDTEGGGQRAGVLITVSYSTPKAGAGRAPLSAKQAALGKGEKIHPTSLGLSQTRRIIAQTSLFFVVLANRFGDVFYFIFFPGISAALRGKFKKPINGSMRHPPGEAEVRKKEEKCP